MDTALHASASDIFSKIEEKPEEDKLQELAEERIIELIEHQGWKQIEAQIDHYCQGLDLTLDEVTKNMSVEEIGYRFLAIKLTKKYLQAIKNLPQALKDAKREQKRTRGKGI